MRSTKVVGFSIPPELHKRLEEIASKTHKTKSEFFRELLNNYIRNQDKELLSIENEQLGEHDLAQLLWRYWDLRSDTRERIIVVGLAIVHHEGRVLIGLREERDRWVENLTWVFPGGQMQSLDFARELKQRVSEETGLKIKVGNLITARIHPDSGFKPVQIVSLYFSCLPAGEASTLKPGSGLAQLKWIKPSHVFKYFNTSTSDEVTRYLLMLERSSPDLN